MTHIVRRSIRSASFAAEPCRRGRDRNRMRSRTQVNGHAAPQPDLRAHIASRPHLLLLFGHDRYGRGALYLSVRILFVGEIVGKAGVFCIKKALPDIKERYNVDFTIADGEGATGGFGLGKKHSVYLHKLGIDVITGGERIYYKRDMVDHIARCPYILRPANYPPGAPGRGYKVFGRDDLRKRPPVAVIVLLGQSGFDRVHPSNPFTYLPELVERVKQQAQIVVVDFHAATTAEKQAMFHHADGKVSAVIGTHTKVRTADESVLTDIGRTGSNDSIGGLDPKIEIRKFLTQIPERSADIWSELELQGVLLDIDEDGHALSIERICVVCEREEHD